MNGLLLFVPIAALIGGVIYVAHRLEKKRTEALRAVATTMGFSFVDKPDAVEGPAFPLFERGHGRQARNLMTGRLADRPAALLDYTYVTGGGKSRTSHNQTVALFAEGAVGLPEFELAPENILHKLGQVFGYQDLDFPGHPEFSSKYLLRGRDEGAIRAAFGATALAFLTGNPGWSVETRDHGAAVFRAGKRCKPEEVPTFLADALRILSGLSPRSDA